MKNIVMFLLAAGMLMTAGAASAGEDFGADVRELARGIKAEAVPTVKEMAPVLSAARGAQKKVEITETLISRCYVAQPPVFRLAVNGEQNYGGSYSDQSLTYAYQMKEEILLVIDSGYGNVTTRSITRVTPQTETHREQYGYSREEFARKAFDNFSSFYADLAVSACK